ncbi:MAG: aldose epimerase family protein [Eubacteriales bacterium]|nr:aldose epimerase family protein [Eubacteriales bacterium]
MSIRKADFGTTKGGAKASLYTIVNENGMEAAVTDFGAILVSLKVPDAAGGRTDVVLGFDSIEGYEGNPSFFGSTIGRNANRIAGAAFTLDGVEYRLADNENGNNLHTDIQHGFHKVMWEGEADEQTDSVRFSYVSPDGENGFPGTLKVTVTYTLQADNALKIAYDAVSDKKTVINLTNHSYFNLAGHDAGSICDEKMTILADGFTEILPGAIPTGRTVPVEGTPMDFRTARRIGDRIDEDWEQLTLVQGYDHNWALHTEPGTLSKIARVDDEKAGRSMEVYTDLPGVQFYAGNCIDPQTGKGGASYGKRCALCLETQYFPNSVNTPSFRQPVFEAGQAYHTETVYKFL